MLTVIIQGLQFHACHGVSDVEQAIGHRYRLDVEIDVSEGSCLTDNVSDTVDYGELGQFCMTFLKAEKHRTVERAAFLLAKAILERYPIASQVRLTLCKLFPPSDLVADAAGVRVSLSRSDLR